MSVASRFIKQDSEKLGIGPFVDSLCAMAVNIHRSVERETVRFYNELGRHNYTTPTSYLELIKLYIELMSKQRDVIFGNQQRYTGGLQKLGETEVMVGELQDSITKMKPVLAQAAIDTAELETKVRACALVIVVPPLFSSPRDPSPQPLTPTPNP